MTMEKPSVSASPQVRLMQAKECGRRQDAKDQYFPPVIFSGAAWPLFLGLYSAKLEAREMSVDAVCACSKVVKSTALRWIDVLIDAGFVHRLDGNVDMRRANLDLTAKGIDAMDRMLDTIETG